MGAGRPGVNGSGRRLGHTRYRAAVPLIFYLVFYLGRFGNAALTRPQTIDSAGTGRRGGHLTPDFTAMMSGLVHAMRADSELAASLRSLFGQDAAAEQIIGRAVRRGELPAPAAGQLARLVHEVIEAQVFRQLVIEADTGSIFACHVVDDIIVPLLAGTTARPGPPGLTKGAATVTLTAFSPE